MTRGRSDEVPVEETIIFERIESSIREVGEDCQLEKGGIRT